MANIQPYIDDILAAVYGEQVRSSIADAILAINDAAITSVVLGSDNKLVITFQDGHTYTSGSLKGAKGDTGQTGATGATGNGIASITLQSTVGTAKTYRITYTNSSHFDFVVNDGAKGDKGDVPEKGVDYWTEEDKQEIVDDVLSNFVDGNGVAY